VPSSTECTDPSDKGSPIEIGSEDSDEDGEVDAPGRKCYTTLAMDKDYKDDAPTFAYNTIQVALSVLFEQIAGFILHPREGADHLPITSVEKIPLDIKGLEKFRILRNPR
jgi:hypothetical protein